MKEKSQKLILLVDDSTDIQDLLKLLLGSRGYRVHCTSNGQEALSLLQKADELPDLILLDAQMPGMDGYRFRQKQLADLRLRNIPVLIMSGDDDRMMREKMSFPRGILVKPLHVNSMLKKISEYLAPTVA